MRTVTQLNQDDVKQILANYFNVDIYKVKLCIAKDYEGIGSMEHEMSRIIAEVEVNEII